MIKGAKYWDNASKTYYIQTNNPTESLLKTFYRRVVKSWLETCGPTAACSCLGALGYDLEISTPGSYRPQHEEVLSDYLNDPKTLEEREKVREGVSHIPGGRIPQFYPLAVMRVFGAKGEFQWLHNFDKIAGYLSQGKTVQLCLRNPGHYIAAVAYDDTNEELIYNDPWPGRTGKGFNLRMKRSEYDKNVTNYIIVYEK